MIPGQLQAKNGSGGYTPAEVARRLGMTPNHVRHLISTGKIRALDVGDKRSEYRNQCHGTFRSESHNRLHNKADEHKHREELEHPCDILQRQIRLQVFGANPVAACGGAFIRRIRHRVTGGRPRRSACWPNPH